MRTRPTTRQFWARKGNWKRLEWGEGDIGDEKVSIVTRISSAGPAKCESLTLDLG
jgi:hypothetical protein